MKKLLIAASTLAFLAAPLAAQAATSSTSATQPSHAKHATVRHHTAKKEHRMSEAKKSVSCPAGSTNAACHPASTGAIK